MERHIHTPAATTLSRISTPLTVLRGALQRSLPRSSQSQQGFLVERLTPYLEDMSLNP